MRWPNALAFRAGWLLLLDKLAKTNLLRPVTRIAEYKC